VYLRDGHPRQRDLHVTLSRLERKPLVGTRHASVRPGDAELYPVARNAPAGR